MAEAAEGASFRIDLVNLCLWRRSAAGGDERLDLAPKRFDILRHLAEAGSSSIAVTPSLLAFPPG